MPAVLYTYDAKLVRVVDGDTAFFELRKILEATFDPGFRCTINSRTEWVFQADLRMARINAPERNTPGGPPAKAALEKILGSGALRIETKRHDKYGRYLGDVSVKQADGSWLNASDEMVRQGHALPWDGQGVKPV
jgi:endonuclease YncB( thermonuclease family)